MGKVESTSDFQSTSANLDGASNTLFGQKIRSHMQKHFCCYQHKASQMLCNKNFAYNGGTSNLILHLERKSIQYQGHGQGWGCQANTQVSATQNLTEANWVESIFGNLLANTVMWSKLTFTRLYLVRIISRKAVYEAMMESSMCQTGWLRAVGLMRNKWQEHSEMVAASTVSCW